MADEKKIERKDNRKSDYHSAMKDVGPYLNLGIQMIIPIIGGAFLGIWLDGKYESSPLWTLILACLGIVVGMYGFFKTVLNTNNNKKNKKK